MDQLLKLRNEGTIGQVIDHLKTTKRPLPSDRILRREEEILSLMDTPEAEWSSTLQRYNKLKKSNIRRLSKLQGLLKSRLLLQRSIVLRGLSLRMY